MFDTLPGIGEKLQGGTIKSNLLRDRPLRLVPFCFYFT